MDFSKEICIYLDKEIEVLRNIDIKSINEAMNVILKTYESNGTIFICGNGGSAATASHFVTDFNKGVSINLNKKFNFQCLNDNIPSVTAIANDIGYDKIFEFQLVNKLSEKDLVIGISGSGNSPNIIKAIQYAKSKNCKTLGITGYDGGELKKISDYSLHAPIRNMQITEDVHLILNHVMMSILSTNLKD